MDINRSGYYKWKYRKTHPSARHIQRMKDIEFIKEESNKHKAHGYRWLAAFLQRKHGLTNLRILILIYLSLVVMMILLKIIH